ncbi:uncharacterized protein MONOS_3071 [Monocercomonoides exilis]|uniref:uncharacterized protein n=1 Tax=Monocercomonoides exilis TaxID=2049356 RepID=UPI00355A0332|nr:hypothetical protein MONOS_3071 [Monocercomonoides exilis]|eukprot:MONOS_3071.1-p1 / transcript=MONOS_3071.1 / gene=MONOS_3071 / organism=Monocercomonoides_exilis_PA203 / gene_product=unspecified product / transcript_product=unspecified product / location=Mono_scaffold00068:132869-141829(+) / protein_length=2956 / sequence_SO=supercontig / SO=protein_coding / is_pseudo=false
MRYLIVTICVFIYTINCHHSHQLATVDHSPGSNIVFNDKNCDMNEYMEMKNACSFGNEELLKNKENYENLDDAKHIKQIKHRNTESLLSFRDYGRISEQSQIIGNMRLINSSIELKGIELMGGEWGRIVCGMRGSVVVVRGCGVEMGRGKEAGVFELGGCRGMFWNITLRGVGRGGNVCGRLFGGGGRMEQTKSEREGGGGRGGGQGRGGGRGEGGERGGQRGGEGRREEESEEGGSVLVSESDFSSFCVSSAPFLEPPLARLVSLSKLTFFNISTNPSKTTHQAEGLSQRVFVMNSCSFTSVCDVYDGGIIPSLNNPLASFTASNITFIGCCRTRNVEFIGSKENPLKPGRQNETENGANTFTWCEWNGSNTTGTSTSISNGTSNGGAIFMYGLSSAIVSVSHCVFNGCMSYFGGGGIMCRSIKSVEIIGNLFNTCNAQNYYGGGLHTCFISACVLISGCEFKNCKANDCGGGLYLDNFQVSGTDCIETEKGGGESACVFDCKFSLCSLSQNHGGGIFCKAVPSAQFKMRSVQFISCSASSDGGGLSFIPNGASAPSDGSCRYAATPYGHDVFYADYYNLYLNSGNPFFECYTTNTDDRRMCYAYNYSNANAWTFQHTEKKEWLKDKTIYVSVYGDDNFELCGANETFPCLTVKKAFEMCEIQISLTITLMEGNHTSEATTVEIGEKKISVIGTGKEKSSIGTGALSSSSPSTAGSLFSVTSGHLGLLHMKVDCNSISIPSPSVVVVSDGGGFLSLEDVVITTSASSGNDVLSSSMFVVQLSQLLMTDVEIKDMNVSKSLFSEPNLSSPSSSSSSLSSLSSSALYLTATASGDSVLANVKVMNVKLTEGDGVVVAKSVKAGETFVVKNVTIEDCECKAGSGGGIKVDLLSPSSKLRVGTSSASGSETTKFNRCKCSGYGGGVMLHLADDSHDFSIVFVDFSGCTASLGGNYVFVNGSDSARWAIATEKLNIQHDNSKYNELMGYDRSNTSMGMLPLNVFLDTISGAAHVGKKKDGVLGRYDSWFCGLDYYPCATITHTAQARFSGGNKKIELDPEFVLAEKVAMDDANEWEISCATKGTAIEVKEPTTFESENFLIDVQSRCSIKKIKFSIPSALSSASSMISAHSTSFNITDCSVVSSPDSVVGQSIGYSFVNAFAGKLRMEQFEIREGLTFDGHSLVEFMAGVSVVYFKGCNIANVRKINGDGGLIKGAVGTQFGEGEGKVGIVVIETCTVINCNCQGKSEEIGKGGGICVSLDGEGSVVVNGTSTIDSCEAKNNGGGGAKGRGGGMMLTMASPNCKMEIAENVKFSSTSSSLNDAQYGKDVFICCDSTILLGTKVNANSFKIFDNSAIPSDELKFCGSEDGKDEKVIPLFVYLFSIGSKLTVDGSGSMAYDHNSCGFEKFGCQSIDYCVTNRINDGLQKVEVSSESSIKSEMKVLSFDVSLTGKAVTEGKKMKIEVKDGGEISQNGLIECTKSFEMTNLAFVMNKVINGRRSAFIHSSLSTITITSCSVSFASDALTSGKIGYNILNIEGGELIVDGLMMEIATTLTMNGKSPITMTNGEKLDIKNSRESGVTVEGGSGGGGCISAAIKDGGNAVVNNCSISTICTGGGGMKGGGMMISVGESGSLGINDVRFTGCEVPTEDNLQKGKGMGGGMFVSLADTMGSFVMEGMKFEGCSAWKGKKVFISGNELDDVISNEKLKEELSSSDEKSLDELCGWERKTTGKGYVIPLVVYLWTNWSGNGFVSKDNGGDFSGCGFSEAPCSSIDHLISLRFDPLGKGETHINIVGSGLLSHSISFSSSLPPASQDSDSPKVVIEGTKKGTSVTITDEDENDLDDGSMISSNVSLSFFNLSFTKPSITTNHAVFIESSGTNAFLTVTDCSFGSLTGLIETAGYCVMKVNRGSATIQSCTLNKINGLKGFISFSKSATEVTVQNVNISFAGVTERSLISMMEEESQMNEKENTHSNANGNRPVLRVVGCSFSNITKEGIGASVVEVGSFENGVECTIEECTMKSCKSALSDEGGGMKVELKNEESVLKVNGSTFSMCRCSTESGRGGGLFINGADPNVNYADETQIPCLRIFIVNIMFYMNEAFVGNDIFIKCYSIIRQINETMFALNFNQESLNSDNSICGSDIEGNADMDLIPRITFFKGLQVFLNGSGADGRRCGAQTNPCSSINCGVDHIQEGVMNAILIDGEGVVSGECVIGDLVVNSFKKKQAIVKLKSKIEKSAEKDCIMEFVNECSVERCSFQFEDGFESTHNYLMKVKNGITKIQECEFFSSSTAVEFMKLNSSIVSVESGELKISETTFRDIHSTISILSFCEESNVTIDETRISNIKCEGDVVSVGGKAKVEMKEMKVENVTMISKGCVIGMGDAEQEVSVLNSSFGKCVNSEEKGSMMKIRNSKNVRVEACVFDGEKETEAINEGNKIKEGLCKWNGSLVDIEDSNVEMRETTIMKNKGGGLWVSGGSMKIEKGEFENNNPSIEGYPSARRNVICEGNCELNVVNVKGGDGLKDNSSLWILDEGCQLGGIASERESSYFIPVLEEVKNTTQPNGGMDLSIHGKLLLPCNLSLKISMKDGDVEHIQTQKIEDGCVSENEVHSVISSELVETMKNKAEISVCILFGKAESPSSTHSLIMKNKSEIDAKVDERMSEGEDKIEWSFIAFIGCIVVIVILLFVIVVVIVLQRRKENRGGRRVEDGDIEVTKNVGIGEWRKEDIAERAEEEEEEEGEMRTLLAGETGNEMRVLTEKGEELNVNENKGMVERGFDREEIIAVVPVNYIEMQSVASLLSGEKDGNMEIGSFAGGKENESISKGDRKVKRGKRKKGKKRKHVEEDDEIGDEREVSEAGLEELGGVTSEDGRNGKSTEYYVGICSAQNSNFSMIGEDSEEKVVNKVLDEAKEVVKEGKEEEREVEKPKKRKKKKKRNQKGEDKSEIVRDIAEIGLLDAG